MNQQEKDLVALLCCQPYNGTWEFPGAVHVPIENNDDFYLLAGWDGDHDEYVIQLATSCDAFAWSIFRTKSAVEAWLVVRALQGGPNIPPMQVPWFVGSFEDGDGYLNHAGSPFGKQSIERRYLTFQHFGCRPRLINRTQVTDLRMFVPRCDEDDEPIEVPLRQVTMDGESLFVLEAR